MSSTAVSDFQASRVDDKIGSVAEGSFTFVLTEASKLTADRVNSPDHVIGGSAWCLRILREKAADGSLAGVKVASDACLSIIDSSSQIWLENNNLSKSIKPPLSWKIAVVCVMKLSGGIF